MLSFDQYLAIDYGSTLLKGVLFKKVLGKVTILRTETLPVVHLDEAEGDPFEYNIVRFIQSFFPEENRFLINLGIHNLFVRDITVPLTNEKAIQEVLPFEIENLVPYPIEELEVIGKTWRVGKENSDVICFNVHHSELQRALRPFAKGDLQLSCLSLDSFVLSTLVSKHYNQLIKERSVMQIDIGGKFTILNIVSEGKLRHTRQIYIGGNEITEYISKLLGIDVSEAESIKQNIQFSIFSDSEEIAKIQSFCSKYGISSSQFKSLKQTILSKLDSLMNQIENSIFSLSEMDRPSLVLLSGGGSLFWGQLEWMQQRFNLPVSRYDFLGIEDSTLVTAIATGIHYESRSKVNFLSTNFAKRINSNRFRFSSFRPHFILVGISIILLLGVFVIGIVLDKRKINANKKILLEKYRNGMGGDIAEDEDVIRVASDRLKAEKKKTEIYRLFLSKESILDLMNEATEQFPGNDALPFVLDQFNFEENEIQIYGRVNEFGEIGTIQAALEKSEKFTNVQVLNKRLITGVNKFKVSFKIKMDIVIPKDEN
ncbi:actin-like ATPase [Leptospira ryugenii]|uniref:Actin-like ATPase n=1 Tax=Leptospira ryugenii TaxID=1917863 RepID=A0A2P2DWS2_9LEPT|nr:pilus assembly protein PilM [Leptospira ryugenii]GBF49079.1 actin-like ATPase [Leptospira ryugenii]